MQPGRTSFEVTGEPLKVQLETFLDEHRAALHGCLDGLTEEQAGAVWSLRRRRCILREQILSVG